MSNRRPSSGTMVWWRLETPPFSPNQRLEWVFGYCTYVSGYDMVRMGRHNGDTVGGSVVSVNDIEWKPYTTAQ